MKKEDIIKKAISKAKQSKCDFKISAIGFNKKGELIGSSFNVSRIPKKGGGIHAEMKLMARYREHLKTILICRTNQSGDLLPIDPCDACARKAQELGIKIISIRKE